MAPIFGRREIIEAKRATQKVMLSKSSCYDVSDVDRHVAPLLVQYTACGVSNTGQVSLVAKRGLIRYRGNPIPLQS